VFAVREVSLLLTIPGLLPGFRVREVSSHNQDATYMGASRQSFAAS
jgi:hypothetical protein